MCLAVPGKVLDIWERDQTRMAKVDFGGVEKDVCLEFVPDIEVGEYTIVHVGFALQRLDEKSAMDPARAFGARLVLRRAPVRDAWRPHLPLLRLGRHARHRLPRHPPRYRLRSHRRLRLLRRRHRHRLSHRARSARQSRRHRLLHHRLPGPARRQETAPCPGRPGLGSSTEPGSPGGEPAMENG